MATEELMEQREQSSVCTGYAESLQKKTEGQKREAKNRIAYTVMIVRDFGEAHHLTPRQAHSYLRRHKAMDFIDKCYEAEHTLSWQDALDDMTIVSKRNGGRLG